MFDSLVVTRYIAGNDDGLIRPTDVGGDWEFGKGQNVNTIKCFGRRVLNRYRSSRIRRRHMPGNIRETVESLERRELLTGSSWYPTPAIQWSIHGAEHAPEQFASGDFVLSSDNWSGRAEGNSFRTASGGLGPANALLPTNDPIGFDAGEFWSFYFDRPGQITMIQFDMFHVEDADRAEIQFANQSVVITSNDLLEGVWYPPDPLTFEAGESIVLSSGFALLGHQFSGETALSCEARKESNSSNHFIPECGCVSHCQ